MTLPTYAKRSTQSGYTLLEALFSIALSGILILLAAPSFASLIVRNELTTQSNAVLESLYYARSQAIAHQHNVHICNTSAGKQRCSTDYSSNRNWSDGWLIFADKNLNNELDDGDEILRTVEHKGNITIVFNQRGRLRYFPTGSARSAGFYLCSAEYEDARHILLLHTGRARVNQNLSDRQRDICRQAAGG